METAVEVIDKQPWIDDAAIAAQGAVERALDATGGENADELKNFLHGKWLGHPLHAALTDLPVGAFSTSVILDRFPSPDAEKAADLALAVGLAGAGLAVLPGLTDWHVTSGRARRIGLIHGLLNLAGAGLFAASLVARKGGNREKGRALSLVGFAASMTAAYLGGKLTYREGVGVEPHHTP
ncbi:MAG: DUF2231 domain-containing protein [Bryobacteraceae bacterium]|nr:DUF2231 domain-containing protein [Bryobacteraceae bacterium]